MSNEYDLLELINDQKFWIKVESWLKSDEIFLVNEHAIKHSIKDYPSSKTIQTIINEKAQRIFNVSGALSNDKPHKEGFIIWSLIEKIS